MSGSWEGLLGSVSPLPEFPIQEINVRTTQGEEKHSKDYFRTNISYQEGFFKGSYSIPAYSKAKKFVMAIVTLLAIETNMVIVTALVIETNMAIVTTLVIKTDMAIMTVLAIEIDIHLFEIKPSIKCKEFVPR